MDINSPQNADGQVSPSYPPTQNFQFKIIHLVLAVTVVGVAFAFLTLVRNNVKLRAERVAIEKKFQAKQLLLNQHYIEYLLRQDKIVGRLSSEFPEVESLCDLCLPEKLFETFRVEVLTKETLQLEGADAGFVLEPTLNLTLLQCKEGDKICYFEIKHAYGGEGGLVACGYAVCVRQGRILAIVRLFGAYDS
jgi:hypothetical protein